MSPVLTRTISTRHWTGSSIARRRSRIASRAGTSRDGELVLYDVSSSYFEGRSCPLAKLGYSRDGKRGTPQIIYGLLCDKPGRPIAVEVFSGQLHDDATLPAQITKLKQRFHLQSVVVVADRGMVTKANMQTLKDTEGIGWITALKAPQIKKLARDGVLQLSLFDEQNLAEITAEDYPGERLIVCRNPLVAAERTRKRSELLEATERDLKQIADRVQKGTLTGASEIGLAVGPAVKRYRMRKHFDLQITDTQFHLHTQDRADHHRGRTGRLLHPAHRPHHAGVLHQRCRALLQESRAGRARVQDVQRPRTTNPPDPPPPRDQGPRARVPLHARLLPHLAPDAPPGRH